MNYIRTKDRRILNVVDENDFDEEEKGKTPNNCTMVYALNMFGCSIVKNENIIQQADTIEDLTQVGDLVKYEDRTTSYPYQTTFVEITKFFKPYHTAIYRVVELYIKQLNGDYKLVAKDKGDYKLELV